MAAAVVASLAGPDPTRAWLGLHLALAGAATVAIGAVLPFLIAALAATRPGSAPLRIATLAALATGTAGVTLGRTAGDGAIAVGGGLLFVAGIAGIGLLLVRILGGALGHRRGLLPRAYAWALAEVAVGALIATAFLGGVPQAVEGWARLKPVHAWLNVFGFLALVIVATLVHLYPTVVGTRIGLRPSVRVALAALAAGPVVVAAGYLVAVDLLARAGALVVLVGALAIVRFVSEVHAARGRWTTDHAWHRFGSWSLAFGVAWFVVAIGIAASRVLAYGATSIGWGIELVGAPLAVGFVLQVLVGSWTHLLPAVGPGDARLHARRRRLLAQGADLRLAALNGGTALLAIGIPLGLTVAIAAGAGAVVLALGGALAVFARAVVVRLDPAAEPLR